MRFRTAFVMITYLSSLSCAALASDWPAQGFQVLATFDQANYGTGPQSLVQGEDGSLYGTTVGGGSHSGGTVFKLTRQGDLITLYNFCSQSNCTDGAAPSGGLVLGSDGNFYGSTSGGGKGSQCEGNGCGTVFRITPRGGLTTIHTFCLGNCVDGAAPGPVIQAADGNVYGTAQQGGIAGHGALFRIGRNGTLATLHSFCILAHCSDGDDPVGKLTQGSDGDLYGVTGGGGTAQHGTVFKISRDGGYRVLHSFNGTDGNEPSAGLTQASDGNFYGTTAFGGAANECADGCGTLFKMTPDGTLTPLLSFDSTNGYEPVGGLIQGTDTNLYGTTRFGGGSVACKNGTVVIGCGTVFETTLDGTLTTLHSFDLTDGSDPSSGVFQATNGNFYGTAISSSNLSGGLVFGEFMNLETFVALVSDAGQVGQTGGILGQGFTGTSRVLLNGVPAKFKVISDTFLEATVPAGATTGYVTVTTPSGKLTSNVPFHVLP